MVIVPKVMNARKVEGMLKTNRRGDIKERPDPARQSPAPGKAPLVVFYLAALAAAVAAVYLPVFSYPRFNPEWSLFFKWNYHLSSGEYWRWYSSFNSESGWFRPTSFVTFYQVATKFIDWHDIRAFQLVGILLLLVNSLFIRSFARQVFPDDTTPLLTAVLSFIHPVFYYPVYNLFMTDFLYQIFILWFGIIYLGDYLERKKAGLWLAGALVLFLLAISSKEQAAGLPIFLAGVMVVEWWFNKKDASLGKRLFKNRLVLLAMTSLVTVLYVALYLKNHPAQSDGAYRIGMNCGIIMGNIRAGLLWLSQIFLFSSSSWGEFGVNNTLSNNLYGGIVLAAVVAYVINNLIRRDRPETQKIMIALLFTGAFLVLPVYSGGRPWHFALPAISFTMLYSRFATRLIERVRTMPVRMVCLGLAIILPLFLSSKNFTREMEQFDDIFFRLNTEALVNPPRPGSAIPEGATIAYYPPDSKWSYGCGYLFSYVYKRQDIIEVPIFNPDSASADTALKYSAKDNFFYFDYDKNRRPAWEDRTEWFKSRLRKKLPLDQKPKIMHQMKDDIRGAK